MKKPSDIKRVEDKDYNRIRWVFRCNAAIGDEPNETTTREGHAEWFMDRLRPHCGCFAFQLESAPTTGYLHYQGYMELSLAKRKKWILENIFPFEYVAPSKGTPKQAWGYSTKEDTRVAGPWTLGAPFAAEDKSASKSADFVKACKAGLDDNTLFDEYPSMMVSHRHAPDHIRSLTPPDRTSPLEVYLFYGAPGTGKTDFAYEQARLMGVYPYEIPLGKDFWLTPDAHQKKYILIDEFKSNLQLKDLLKLLDKRALKAPVKGGFVWWCPDIIVITTNKNPWEWYTYVDRDWEREALFRRITAAYLFEKNAAGIPQPKEVTLDSLKPVRMAFSPNYLKACDRYEWNSAPLPMPQERFQGGYKRTFVSPEPPAKKLKATVMLPSTLRFTPPPTHPSVCNKCFFKTCICVKDVVIVPDTPPDMFEQDKMEMEQDKVVWDDFGPTQPIAEMENPDTIPKGWF